MPPEAIRTYSAKIILFGEHTILRGSRALAVPYPHRSGRWAWGTDVARQRDLVAFAKFLYGPLGGMLDLAAFDRDLAHGLYFDSDIPTGYGLGSSGALCAAVFDRYAHPEARKLPAAELKPRFADMESFFHGRSSGTDPLISYLNTAVCLLPGGTIQAVSPPVLTPPWRYFLLDTGHARATGPLVRYFTERFDTDAAFRRRVEQEWTAATERAIDAGLEGDGDALWSAFTTISSFQRRHLPPMVPNYLHQAWDHGLAGDDFRLKICGAGGGGYCLGLARDWDAAQWLSARWKVEEV